MANTKRKPKFDRASEVQRMIRELLNRGIRYEEITGVARVSRWILNLWLDGRHEPSEENYEAVKKAYEKFAPWNMTTVPKMISELMTNGFTTTGLRAALGGVAKDTLRGWHEGSRAPQAKKRQRLERLYKKHQERA